jgi:DNA-directed RNA polymerase subunit RPC12/RpoP
MAALLPTDPAAERRAEGWSGTAHDYPPGPDGLEYECATCHATMHSPSGARKHEHANKGHVCLRCDWLRDDYFEFVLLAGRARG